MRPASRSSSTTSRRAHRLPAGAGGADQHRQVRARPARSRSELAPTTQARCDVAVRDDGVGFDPRTRRSLDARPGRHALPRRGRRRRDDADVGARQGHADRGGAAAGGAAHRSRRRASTRSRPERGLSAASYAAGLALPTALRRRALSRPRSGSRDTRLEREVVPRAYASPPRPASGRCRQGTAPRISSPANYQQEIQQT